MRGPGWGLRANTGAGLRVPPAWDSCGTWRTCVGQGVSWAPLHGWALLQMCTPSSGLASHSSPGSSSVLSENGKWLRRVWECGDLLPRSDWDKSEVPRLSHLTTSPAPHQSAVWAAGRGIATLQCTPSKDTRFSTLLSRINVMGRSLVGAMGWPGPAAGQPTHLPWPGTLGLLPATLTATSWVLSLNPHGPEAAISPCPHSQLPGAKSNSASSIRSEGIPSAETHDTPSPKPSRGN